MTGEAVSYPLAAAATWIDVSGAIVRGLVHTLNNRVASVEGIAATLEGAADVVPARTAMEAEGERLRGLTEMARLIADEDAPAEAATITDLLAGAATLARLHPDMRDTQLDVRGAENMPAVRVRQRRTTHAFVLAMLAAAAENVDTLSVMCVTGTTGDVELRMRPMRAASPGDGSARRTDAANALLASEGGSALLEHRAGSRAVVVTLSALRRERR